MRQYLDAVRTILDTGTRKENRTGVDTLSTFGVHYNIDLQEGFPLLTTKAINFKNIVVEMLWFLSGKTDIGILKKHGCKFWDAWSDSAGKVPSAYGNFWRRFPVPGTIDSSDHTIDGMDCIRYNDQIRFIVDTLKRDPMSRRMVVSAWAPGNAQTSKLPPCHCLFVVNVQNVTDPLIANLQRVMRDYPSVFATKWSTRINRVDAFIRSTTNTAPGWTREQVGQAVDLIDAGSPLPTEKRLCLHLTQRSCDIALGVPYNIASYALLMHLFSRFSGIPVGTFSHTLVDAHAYTAKPDGSKAEFDHVPGLREQLTREPRPLPRLHIDESIRSLEDVERLMGEDVTTEQVMANFTLAGYDPHPAIPFKVAV